MMFKQIANRIEVRRYEGYSKEKKRSEVKLLGSFNRHTLVPTEELLSVLTDEQKKELQAYIETVQQETRNNSLQYAVQLAVQSVKNASDSIRLEVATDEAQLAELSKAVAELNRIMGNRKRRKKPVSAKAQDKAPALATDADKSP